jgi:hypothetical protein
LDLGTRVNGVAGGRCQGGQCEVSGGTAAGANLFHRFNRFDTRGEIRGVSIQNGPYRTVVLGVLDPLGSFLNKGISLSSPAHLFFLSPGGLHVGAGVQFFNTPRLTLSTASSLGLGSGRFEVFRTTAAEAALLTGVPIRGKGGSSGDPAEAQRNGITSGGDLVVDGGLIQVDEELLLDAQGANLLLQAGSQLAVPGGSVELNGKNVTVAAGALVTTSAQASAAPAPALGTTTAPGPTTAPAEAPVVPAPAAVATTAANSAAPALSAVAEAAVATSAATPATPALATAAANPSPTTVPAQTPAALVEAPAATATTATSAAPEPATPVLTAAAANPASATPQTSALQVPAAVAGPLPETNPPAPVQIPAGLDGGVIRISASNDALVAGQLKALGVAATASGTAASGQAGKGGRIEITGQRVALTGAVLDASGPAGGGTVLLGGDVRGANPAVPNASSTTVDGASTVRADALAKGDGGTVIVYATDSTSVHGQLSARGGPSGGNGGFVETSGGYLDLSRTPEMGALSGKGGTWLIDPQNIVIGPSIEWLSTGNFPTTDDRDKIWQLKKPNSSNTQPAFLSLVSSNWNPNDELSSWISDNSNYAINGSSDVGSFTFFAEFSIPSIPATGTLATLTTYADDQVTALKVNDQAVNIGNIPNQLFGTPATSLSLDASLFSPGMNKIEIIVHNQPFNGLNPVAFRARFAGDLPIELTPVTKNATVNLDGQTTTFTPANPNQATWLSSPTINAALNQGSNVIVDTTNTGTGIGNITVNSPINKTAGGAASLTLNAHNNIVLNSNISSTSAALNLNLNADIDGNGSGATSLVAGARLSLNDGTVTANGPISMAANSIIKDAQIVAPAINSVGGVLENILSLNVDNLTLNGGSLQANGMAMVNTLELSNGSISGSGDLKVFQSFNRSGGTIDGNFSNLSITQASGSLSPGALSAAGPVTLRAQNGQLNLNAPITASTVLARGSSGITLSGGASLTASAPSGRTITLDAGSGAFLNNYSAGAAALVKQPGATWAIYAANPTTTPPANLGGLPYNFKQYNQTFDTNQGSNPILGSGNGLFFANSPTLSVNLLPVSKVYDGEVKVNPSTLNYNVTGVLAGDEVTINKPATGVYDNKSAGTGKLISVSGLSVTSAKDTEALVPVYGYSLSSTEASAAIGTITPLDLPLTGLVALDKVYDATTVAPLQGSRAAVSPLSGDQVTVGGTAAGAFGDKNVGIDKAVTVTGLTIAGKDAGNYNLLQQTGLVATISRKDLPVTGLVALDKVYDATTVAPLGGSAAVSPFSGDEVTVGGTAAGAFSDKNVGIDKAVTVTGVTIAGNDAGNYNLLPLTNLKAAITPAPLQISASSDSKIYDGTTQSSLAPKITQGGLWGDDRLTGLAQTYESKNALGAGQSKLIVSAYTLSDGNNGGNYVLSFLPGLGTINRASVTPSFTVKSKQYDGNVAAEIAGDSLQGGLASDEVFMVGASALFDNAYAANDKLVTITGYTLSGQDADNYQLSSPTATSTASITTQQDNGALPSNEEPIKNKEANPAVGLQLSKLSSPTASKSVDVDISNIVLLPPGASVLESTPSGSTQSQPTPTAASATSSVPNQSQPTASATAVTTGSATQEYQESDNRSAEDAKTSLGLSNAPSSEPISPARLQLVMQSAASFIRKYPVRTLNQ